MAARGVPPVGGSARFRACQRQQAASLEGRALELLSGWASLASTFAGAYRRLLLMAASFVAVLATGMWLGAQLRGGGSTGGAEPSEPVTGSAMVAVPPDILEQPPAASEPAATESGAAALFWPAPRPASASVPQETDTLPAAATGQETAAVAPQVADKAPDPVLEAADSVPEAADPVPEAADPVPAAPDPAAEVPEPVPEAPEPEPVDPDPKPAGPEEPEALAKTGDAEVAAADNTALEGRWTVVAEGTVPDKLVERALDATSVLDEIMSAPDQGIQSSLLGQAGCVAVIPNVKKVGFIFGVRYGRGLVSCRTERGWSRPSFVSITGGSFGFQIGAQSTDFVLVFANRPAADRLLGDKFTLGADASVSAGPVGKTAEAGTDVTLRTEIYAYSRSRGLFAGVSLEGASLATDLEANEDAYGEPLGPEELLLNDSGRLPAELATFVQTLAALAAG